MTTELVRLEFLATVALGYKSLQNEFFYVGADTVSRFHIEDRFLRPITRLKDLEGTKYIQKQGGSVQLFYCVENESDLRGTEALKYIRVMADRPATKKKQSGRILTIKEALAAQSGGRWFAPKAKPHAAHIWLRKAFDGVYAPFVFKKPVVMDQRCN
jgi:hypothetical protein